MLNARDLLSRAGLEFVISTFSSADDIRIKSLLDFPIKISQSGSKKRSEVKAMLEVLPPGETITEIGSGSGVLAKELAKSAKVHCIEVNNKLFRKPGYQNPNIILHQGTAENVSVPSDVYVGLHSCGDLTDTVLRMAVEHQGSVVVMPCCYAKISREDALSVAGKSLKGNFLEVLRAAKYFEGKDLSTLKQLSHLVVTLDRATYLAENGYAVDLFALDTKGAHHTNLLLRGTKCTRQE